ncbi:unnamed protein product [Schistosoma mattheei]|uniref:Uncharacterized protein n=1 Tax=Schistosoma mattheei TaxID=31246 RepID=A0A3P8HU66_9TREM|nr:unnamed protein product [Schistosoma mattheei]
MTLGRGEHVCPPIRAVPVEGRLFGSLFKIDELEASKRRAAGESSDRDGLDAADCILLTASKRSRTR